jgi:hypothetical protein
MMGRDQMSGIRCQGSGIRKSKPRALSSDRLRPWSDLPAFTPQVAGRPASSEKLLMWHHPLLIAPFASICLAFPWGIA